MAKPVARIWLLEVVFLLAVVAIVGRAAQLQLLQGSRWARTAAETRTERVPIVARRGAIYDRSGTPLAVTQEFYHVGIAPREVTDRKALVRAAARALGLPQGRIDRGLRGSAYLYFHGPYTASEVDTLRSFRGVHLEVEYNRFYPSRELARPVIGSLAPDGGDGASGLESALNDLLTGTPGEQVVLKDRAGRRYESPGRIIRRPVPGYDVTLTIDAALQEIAEAGLEEAIASNDASGGDVVFYDSRTGEILALASRQRTAGGFSNRPTALTDPFEPGSTAKLFTAAALLSGGLVSDTDAEDAEDGRWLLSVSEREPPRLLEDSHISHGRLTLAQAVEVSSNIVMAKFSFRLTREQQYEMLRGFGFGSPTGVEYPSESRGRLQRPDGWTEYTRPSLAIGYEFSVTPLQLAAAYGAIANDGILLAPSLVREVRDVDGRELYRHDPEPVRRAVTPTVAARLRDFLRGAVSEGGTGARAQMENYQLIGKTGTARRVIDGKYAPGRYTASFAALFPADDPRLVVIVKVDDPRGGIYGAQVAAPITRRMLEQALTAREVSIDRASLASGGGPEPVAHPARVEPEPGHVAAIPWPFVPDTATARGSVAMPDVLGQDVRHALTQLHRRGLTVQLHGLGTVRRTWPAAGDSIRAGATVSAWAE